MMNNSIVEACCPRCKSAETQDHIVRCLETIKIRKTFIEKLLIEMLKNREEVKVDLIILFCKDMLQYLEHETEEEHETNQCYNGMKELFH